MSSNPPPIEPTPPAYPFNPDEQPAQRVNRPPEGPPTQRQAGYPPTQPEHYPSGPPASAVPPPPPGGYPVMPEGSTTPGAGQPPSAAPEPDMPDYSHYGDTQQARPASKAQTFWHELTLLGQVAGVAGVLLLIFFFLPWSFTPDVSAASTQITNRIPTTWHSGWTTAAGVPLFGGTTNFNIFPHLWLVVVCALALIVLAVMLGRHRIGLRVAAILTTVISLFALLLEILFLIQINSFQAAIDDLAGGRLNQALYGVSWGFWLALVATVVALGVAVYMLYQEHASHASTAPQRHRFPGDQQPTPTA